MLIRYTTNNFPTEYIPRTDNNCSNYSADVLVDGAKVRLGLWDYANGDDRWEDRLRALSYYPHTDVHVLVFSLISEGSFNCIEREWLPRVRRHSPTAPLVLVGTKLDMRGDETTLRKLAKQNGSVVSRERGAKLARKWGAVGYRECSAKTGEGVNEVFETAVRAALQYKNDPTQRRKRCVVM